MPALSLTRRRALALGLVLLALLALAGHRLAGAGTSEPVRPAAAIIPVAAAAPARLVVHVAGAVRRPGLYKLRDGARVADAVRHAGGALSGADLTAINLAARVMDGIQVVVPARVRVGAAAPAGGATSSPPGPVSLGSATLDQLDDLPGVGPVTAQKIVDYRAAHGGFRSVDDLDAIPGIGPARIEQIRDLVTP